MSSIIKLSICLLYDLIFMVAGIFGLFTIALYPHIYKCDFIMLFMTTVFVLNIAFSIRWLSFDILRFKRRSS